MYPCKYTYVYTPDHKHDPCDVAEINVTITKESLVIRDEHIGKFMVFPTVASYCEIYHIKKNDNKFRKHLTHEVIFHWQKQLFKADLDGGTEEDHSVIIEMLIGDLYDISEVTPRVLVLPSINTTNGETKVSKHIIATNIAFANSYLARAFTAKFKSELPEVLSKIVDNTNSQTQNFRLALTTNKSGRTLKLPAGVAFEDTIITNVKNDAVVITGDKCNEDAAPDQKHTDIPAEFTQYITCGNAFRFHRRIGDLFVYSRMQSSHCDLCNRVHDNIGAFIVVHHNIINDVKTISAITRHCYRSTGKSVLLWKLQHVSEIATWYDFLSKYSGRVFTISRIVLQDQIIAELQNIVRIVDQGETTVYLTVQAGRLKIQKYATFIESARRKHCFYTEDGLKQKINFGEVIRTHEQQLLFAGAVFRPSGICPPKYVNTFLGYAATVTSEADLIITDTINPLITHLRDVICSGDLNLTDYILDWFAHIIQHGTKTGTVIVLHGEQGVGKNTFTDFIRDHVIGTEYSADCKDIESVTAKFNANFASRVLTIINEANVEGDASHFHRVFDKMKDLITNTKLLVERKGIDSYHEDDFCNYIITTNNERAIKLEPGDRRYTVVKCSSVMKGNIDYFTHLHNTLTDNSKHIANCFITFLKNRKIINNVREPYMTDFKKELIAQRTDLITEFISTVIYESNEVPEDTLYTDIENFAIQHQYKTPMRVVILKKLSDIGFIKDRIRTQKREYGKKINYYNIIIDDKYIEREINIILDV
jgi:Family of unknown function (DUF5906)